MNSYCFSVRTATRRNASSNGFDRAERMLGDPVQTGPLGWASPLVEAHRPVQSPNDRVMQTWSDAETFSPVVSLPIESPATRRSQLGSLQAALQPSMSTAVRARIDARTNLLRPAIRHPLVEANTCLTALPNTC